MKDNGIFLENRINVEKGKIKLNTKIAAENHKKNKQENENDKTRLEPDRLKPEKTKAGTFPKS